jgi:hypothetical protein
MHMQARQTTSRSFDHSQSELCRWAFDIILTRLESPRA